MIKNELPLIFPNDLIDSNDYKSLFLPINFIPVYSQYHDYGFAIVENYIDVVIYDNDYSKNINFYAPNFCNTFGCFDYSVFNSTTSKLLQSSLIDLFIDFIDRGYYVYYMIDAFYISNYSERYQNEHFEHGVLLYGYDTHKRVFMCMDYFDSKKLDVQLIHFDEILGSNINFDIERNYGIDCSGNAFMIQAFKLEPKMIRCPNIDIFKNKLMLFINNTPLDTYEGMYYGIQMFDILVKRFEADEYIPIKHFAFIMSHIFLMSVRMKILYEAFSDDIYMEHKKHLDDLYVKAYILKNIYIKYLISKKKSLKNNIIEKTIDLKNKYKDEIQSIIES